VRLGTYLVTRDVGNLRCQAQMRKAIFGAIAIVGIAIQNEHMVYIGQRLARGNDQAIEGAIAIAMIKVRMMKALRSRAGHPALFQHVPHRRPHGSIGVVQGQVNFWIAGVKAVGGLKAKHIAYILRLVGQAQIFYRERLKPQSLPPRLPHKFRYLLNRNKGVRDLLFGVVVDGCHCLKFY